MLVVVCFAHNPVLGLVLFDLPLQTLAYRHTAVIPGSFSRVGDVALLGHEFTGFALGNPVFAHVLFRCDPSVGIGGDRRGGYRRGLSKPSGRSSPIPGPPAILRQCLSIWKGSSRFRIERAACPLGIPRCSRDADVLSGAFARDVQFKRYNMLFFQKSPPRKPWLIRPISTCPARTCKTSKVA